jgi:hypothetical protein
MKTSYFIYPWIITQRLVIEGLCTYATHPKAGGKEGLFDCGGKGVTKAWVSYGA